MISSMTGYGRGASTCGDLEISVEVRSVNNRFLDVSMKLPKLLANYEQPVREIVGQYVNRGRVNAWLNIKGGEDKADGFAINRPMISAYLRLADEIKKEYNVAGELSLHEILALPDVIAADTETEVDDETWNCAKTAITAAMQQLVAMRDREGIEIQKDFYERIRMLEQYVQKIKAISVTGPAEELEKLKERARRLIGNDVIDEYRLEMELALISDRIDISEECTRFISHITLFREMLESDKSQGRQLNFLLQEMNREANTMSSKAYTAEISHLVVKIKEEIEKIREQVQNIE